MQTLSLPRGGRETVCDRPQLKHFSDQFERNAKIKCYDENIEKKEEKNTDCNSSLDDQSRKTIVVMELRIS